MRYLLRLLVFTVLIAAVTHVIYSAVLAIAMQRLYPHRMFNIRKLDDQNLIAPLALSMLNSAAGEQLIVFVGSSMTFGYDYEEPLIFSRIYASSHPTSTVLNLSVLSGSVVKMADNTVCAMRHATRRPDDVVVEMAVINDVAHSLDDSSFRPSCQTRPLVVLFLSKPFGLKWLSLLRDEHSGHDDRPMTLGRPPADLIAAAERYEMIRADLRRRRVEFFSSLKSVSGRVHVYPAPMYLPGLKELGFDTAALQQQIDDAMETYRSVTGIHCIDTSALATRPELFINTTHLGLRGHQFFAQWIADQIDPKPSISMRSMLLR